MGLENIDRPTTKWVFESFFNLDVKALQDRQPLVGTGPLPNWLRNLAHGRAIAAMDTFRDNLCLWCCIAVHRGVRVDRSTAAARQLAQSFFNIPTNACPKTAPDRLDKVEQHFNQGKALADWPDIRVHEPEREEEENVVGTSGETRQRSGKTF